MNIIFLAIIFINGVLTGWLLNTASVQKALIRFYDREIKIMEQDHRLPTREETTAFIRQLDKELSESRPWRW